MSCMTENKLEVSFSNKILILNAVILDSDPDLCEEIDILTEEKNVPLWRRLSKLLHAYFRQPVFPAAFGLTMLYMTVLGFDGVSN